MVVEKGSDSPLIKIADFGLGKILEKGKTSKDSVGTITYASPEVLTGEEYTEKIDIWSLGVIFFILLTTQMPFSAENSDTLREDVQLANYKIPFSLKGTPKENIIKRMLCVDKDRRADIAEVKKLIELL